MGWVISFCDYWKENIQIIKIKFVSTLKAMRPRDPISNPVSMCPYKILLNEVINLDLQLKKNLLRVSMGLETIFFISFTDAA